MRFIIIFLDNFFSIIGDTLITVGSIVISGLLSWFISKAYFNKGNKKEAERHILDPIKRIIADTPEKEQVQFFRSKKEDYLNRYLNKEQRDCIDSLFIAYDHAAKINWLDLRASCIVDHFYSVLEEKEINYHIEPTHDNEGNEIYRFHPSELSYLNADVRNILVQDPDYFRKEKVVSSINWLLNYYNSEHIGYEEKIDFFDKKDLDTVYASSERTKDADKKWSDYEKLKKTFYKLTNL